MKNKLEIVLGLALLTVILLKIDPFHWLMPDQVQMVLLALLAAGMSVWVGLLYRQRPRDEREGQVMLRARPSIDAEDTADTVNGHGLSTNIIEASLEAYLAGLEKLLWHEAAAAEPATAGEPNA